MADDKRYMGFWIGHLHIGERNRIQAGQLNPQERDMLAKGEDPWAKFRGPLPPSIPAYVPTKEAEEIAATATDELREHVDRQLDSVVNSQVADNAFQQADKSKSAEAEKPAKKGKSVDLFKLAKRLEDAEKENPPSAEELATRKKRLQDMAGMFGLSTVEPDFSSLIKSLKKDEEAYRKRLADMAKPPEWPRFDVSAYPPPLVDWSRAENERRKADAESNARAMERAMDNALKKAEERARAQREMEDMGRQAGFTPIAELPPNTLGNQSMSEASKPNRRKLTGLEIAGLIFAIAIPVVGFVLSAPSAAGVTGVFEAREMLVAAWLLTVVGAFVVELLSNRSWRRIGATTLSSAILMAACLLFIDHRIGAKKRQQEDSAQSQTKTTTDAPTAGSLIFGEPYPPVPLNETYQHRRFRTECPDKNPIWSKYDLSGKEIKGTYQVETIVCVQGEVRAVALYMYFPSDERTIPAITRMSDQYKVILLKLAGRGLVEYPPKPNPSRYKVTFAGRIFIYTEDDMSDEQAVSLSAVFSRKGAAMTISTPPDAAGIIHAH